MVNVSCQVITYNNNDNDNCPSGTTYKGEIYSHDNDKQTAYPVCSDPDMTCPTCENCSSGVFEKVMEVVNETGKEVCEECLFNSDCKTGYQCNGNDKCEIKD